MHQQGNRLCLLTLAMLLFPFGWFVESASPVVTLFYNETLGPLYVDGIKDVCSFAARRGISLQCLPEPRNPLDPNDRSKLEAAITEAAKLGPVLLSPYDLDHFVNLGPFVAREKRYRQFLNIPTGSIGASRNSVSINRQVSAVFYNRGQLRQMGLSMPPSPMTWEGFAIFMQMVGEKANATTQTAMGRYGIGLNMSTGLLDRVLGLSGSRYSSDNPAGVHDEGFRWTMGVLQQLYNSGIAMLDFTVDMTRAWNAFTTGQIPVALGTLANAYTIAKEIDWVVMPLPQGPNGQIAWAYSGGFTLGIASASQDVQLGWDTLMWLAAGEGADYYAAHYPLAISAPLILGKAPQLPPAYRNRGVEDVFQAATQGQIRGWPMRTYDAFRAITPVVAKYAKGIIPLEDALLEMEYITKSLLDTSNSNTPITRPPEKTVTKLPPRPGATTIKVHALIFSGIGEPLAQAVRNRFKQIDVEVDVVNMWRPDTLPDELARMVENAEYDLFIVTDIWPAGIVADLARKGAILPLDAFIAQDKVDVGAYSQLLNQMRVDGKIYDLPLAANPYVVIYNKTIFDQVGIAYPKPGWTWDDFLYTASVINKDVSGVKTYGLANYLPFGWLWHNTATQAAGSSVLTGSMRSIDRTLQVFTTLLAEDAMGIESSTNALFTQGLAAMTIAPVTYTPRPGAVPLHLGMVPLPVSTSGNAYQAAGSVTSVVIPTKTRNQHQAWEVARFLTSDEGASVIAQTSRLPARLTPAAVSAWAQKQWLDASSRIDGWEMLSKLNLIVTPSPTYGKAEDVVKAAMQQHADSISAGNSSPNQAIASLRQLILEQGGTP